MAGRPKGKENTSESIKKIVSKLLYQDLKSTGKELKEQVEKMLDVDFTERTYQNIKDDVKPFVEKVKNGNLEKLWSVGSLSQYSGMPVITPESVQRILKVQSIATYPVTIRRARWIAYLHPVIGDDDLLKDISFNYAYAELLADLQGEQFDSAEYDKYLKDKTSQKKLIKIFSKNDIDADMQNAIISRLTHSELSSPISKIEVRDNRLYAIAQSRYILAKNIVTSNAYWKVLQNKGFIPKNIEYKDGEIILNKPFLLTKQQLQNILKDGETNG